MCFGLGCPYEKPSTGECRGSRDWNQPDASCNGQETQPRDLLVEYEHQRWAANATPEPTVFTCFGR